MSRVFINYRRLDSAAYAGRLYDRLIHDLGRDSLFMDIEKIDPGDDWVEVIEQRLETCGAVIVLIGPAWIDCKDESGERRLDNPDDHVRRELAVALQRKVRVVPVLVGGASMPRSDKLPPELALLVRRNAIDLSDQRFHHDVDRLVEVVRRMPARPEAPGPVPAGPAPIANVSPAVDASMHEQLITGIQIENSSSQSIAANDVAEPISGRAAPLEPALPKETATAAPEKTSSAHVTVALNPGPLLRSHQKPVKSVAYSPDGKLLASAGGGDFFGGDTAIRIWNLPKSKLLREIPGHKDQITCIAFLPDGETLASCSLQMLRFWRVEDGKRLLTMEEDFGELFELSSDETLLLSDSKIYRLSDGELVRDLGGDESSCFALWPDGQHVARMSNKRWQKCRISDGEPVLDVQLKPEVSNPNIALSADGQWLAAGWHHDNENWIALFETIAGKLMWERRTDTGVDALRFHPQGTVLAGSNGSGEELVLWHLTDGEVAARVKMRDLMLSFNEVHGIAFSQDGKQLAAACHDGIVRQWEVTFRQDAPTGAG